MISNIKPLEGFRTPFGLFSGESDVPDRLLVKPIDPWPGEAAEGHRICAECDSILNGHLNQWPERLHRFFWLRDLRAYGGKDARSCAKSMTDQWIEYYGDKPRTKDQKLAWRADILGERIANWISHFDFIESCQIRYDEVFHDAFMASLYEQSRTLYSVVTRAPEGLECLKALKGLLYAGLAFEGHEHWAEKALGMFEKECAGQILSDGTHITRSPINTMRALQILLDVKNAMTAAAYPAVPNIQHTIDRIGQALKVFRYNDKSLAAVNGSFEVPSAYLDTIMAQAGIRGKAMKHLPDGGYERAQMGRMTVLFDCGAPPKSPHDVGAHAAPLSFELIYGKDRVFTSCGSHYHNPEWADMLRATAAHNTVTLDQRNAYEIGYNKSFARKAIKMARHREDTTRAVLMSGAHDGYVSINGMRHARQLYMCDNGERLVGEDTLEARQSPNNPVDIAVRFHVHPRVMVSLNQGGDTAILRLPNGIGWRFTHSVGVLKIEDSIYCGDGRNPRKTKQIVIYGQTQQKESTIGWNFKRDRI